MKMLVQFFAIAIVCLALSPYASGAQEKIPIGVIYGEAGRTTEGLSLELLGTRFAVEELNRNGGILGKQIDLVELDNNNWPFGSRLAAQKAVDAGVVALIGPTSSSHAMLAGAVLQDAKIPMITTFATNPEVTLLGDYIFRINFSDTLQGHALADFAIQDLGANTAVILTCADEKYSIGLSEIFRASYQENSGKVLWEGTYLKNYTDFQDLLEKATRYNPDIVFLPGYDQSSGFMIRQCRNLGKNVVFLGADAWSDSMYQYGGDTIEGSYFSGAWYLGSNNPITRDFVGRYKDRFQSSEIISLGLSHDAVYLLADAIRRAKSPAPSATRDALATTKNFQGVTGTITMDQNGDPLKPIPIYRFEKGTSVLVKTVAP